MAQQNKKRQVAATGAYALSAASLTIALTVLAGWALHLPALRRFVPGYVSMNPVTALCLAGLSVALMLLRSESASASRRRLGQALATGVLLIALVRLASAVFGWNSGIDQWLFAAELGGDGSEPASRIATRSAISLALASLGLLLLDTRTRRGGARPNGSAPASPRSRSSRCSATPTGSSSTTKRRISSRCRSRARLRFFCSPLRCCWRDRTRA